MTLRGEQPWLSNRSRSLRSTLTAAERALWYQLRDRRLNGYKFVRQAAIDPYFADSLCRDQLIVEVDGDVHATDAATENDAKRTAYLERAGYRVLCLSNRDIHKSMPDALNTIVQALEKETS